MVKLADACKEKTKKFLEHIILELNDSYFEDDRLFQVKWLLENNNLSHAYAVIDKETGDVYDVIIHNEYYNILTLMPLFYGNIKDVLEEIKNNFSSGILVDVNGISVEKYGFYRCNNESSFADGYNYWIDGDYAVSNKEMVYLLRDNIELIRFPELHDINFKFIEGDDCNSYFRENYTCPTWVGDNGFPAIIGFHYLQTDFNENDKLLIAETQGMPVGAIKVGYYDYGMPHYGLCYIDVCQKYRGHGVATKLIHELTKYIDNSIPLVLSTESDMGKICHMEQHFKKKQWNTRIYTAKEWEKAK